jgi:K+-transporting ATPase ATPase C chain
MKTLGKELVTSGIATVVLAAILGLLYPAVVWMAAGVLQHQAGGSLVVENGKTIGSELIGQNFTSDRYFNSRPSAAGNGYDPTSSGGSNYGPLSQKLLDSVKDRVADYRKKNGLGENALVPADAVLASASGLDPHISVQNALLQVPRVARARGIREDLVRHFVEERTEGRELGFLGQPRVNVLLVNLDLDRYPGRGN